MTSSKIGHDFICTKWRNKNLGVTLFATASQRLITRCQVYNFVEFIAKTEEFCCFYVGLNMIKTALL